jgi:hypothetical protein
MSLVWRAPLLLLASMGLVAAGGILAGFAFQTVWTAVNAGAAVAWAWMGLAGLVGLALLAGAVVAALRANEVMQAPTAPAA